MQRALTAGLPARPSTQPAPFCPPGCTVFPRPVPLLCDRFCPRAQAHASDEMVVDKEQQLRTTPSERLARMEQAIGELATMTNLAHDEGCATVHSRQVLASYELQKQK